MITVEQIKSLVRRMEAARKLPKERKFGSVFGMSYSEVGIYQRSKYGWTKMEPYRWSVKERLAKVRRIIGGADCTRLWIDSLWESVRDLYWKEKGSRTNIKDFLDWLVTDGYADCPERLTKKVPCTFEQYQALLVQHDENTMRRILLAFPCITGEEFSYCLLKARDP